MTPSSVFAGGEQTPEPFLRAPYMLSNVYMRAPHILVSAQTAPRHLVWAALSQKYRTVFCFTSFLRVATGRPMETCIPVICRLPQPPPERRAEIGTGPSRAPSTCTYLIKLRFRTAHICTGVVSRSASQRTQITVPST